MNSTYWQIIFDFMHSLQPPVATPMVTTIHGFSSPHIVPVYEAYDDIAHYCRSVMPTGPDLRYDAMIHHGIDLSHFTFQPDPGEYLLFLGRIHPTRCTSCDRGRQARGLPLIIAGMCRSAYFRDACRPHIDDVGSCSGYPSELGRCATVASRCGARACDSSLAEPFGTDRIISSRHRTARCDPVGSMPSSGTTVLISDVCAPATVAEDS